MTSVYQQFYDFPDLRSDFHWYTHLVGWVASISCAILGSLMAARDAVRLQPAEAMRPPPPKQGGSVWLEEIQFVWQRLDSAWRMTLRGILRNRSVQCPRQEFA